MPIVEGTIEVDSWASFKIYSGGRGEIEIAVPEKLGQRKLILDAASCRSGYFADFLTQF